MSTPIFVDHVVPTVSASQGTVSKNNSHIMSRKRSAIHREEEEYAMTEGEEEEEEENEYERERAERIASNNAFMQSAVDAATAFNVAIAERKGKSQKRKKEVSEGPRRRSGRLRSHGVSERPNSSSSSSDNGEDKNGGSGTDKSSESEASEGSEFESASDKSDDRRKERAEGSGVKHRKGQSSSVNVSAHIQNVEGRVDSSVPCYRTVDDPNTHVAHGIHTFPSSSAIPMHSPGGLVWIPMAPDRNGTGLFKATVPMASGNFTPNWAYVNGGPRADVVDRQGSDTVGFEKGCQSMSSSIKEESMQKRKQRAKKRAAEEDARKRETVGLKPYTVQVRSSGVIDSGCAGHLKWQEFVRDLTPRMLDMSVMKYEEQNEDSKEKLREALRARFEFLDHEMTDLHLDRIIKTWVRRNRERMKRVHGGKLKAPRKYVDTQWDALRQYWDTPASRQKSERMSETRKKVTSNPRVGRQGYAGKKAKLRSEREVTPDVTDVAKELQTAMVNPDTAEMEKKNSQRLSAMEKRLEDVLQSNLNLQTMLQSVLKTVSPDINVKELRQSAQSGGDGVHEPSTNEEKRACPDPGNSTGLVNTEGWWDKVCKLTDEENERQEGDQQRVDTMRKSKDQMRLQERADRSFDEATAMDCLGEKDQNTQKRTRVFAEKHKSINKKGERRCGLEARTADSVQETLIKHSDHGNLKIGDKVWLAGKVRPDEPVANGTIIGLGGSGVFHHRPIPPEYVRVNLTSVSVNEPLLVPVEEAEQENLSDALGSSVLWLKKLTMREC